jgi:hypothetical protein
LARSSSGTTSVSSSNSAHLILLGAHLAEHDRIDDLKVRGVGGQRQVNIVAVELAVG